MYHLPWTLLSAILNTKSSRFYTVKASIEYWAKDFKKGTQPDEGTVVSGEEQGKRLRDALCDVTRPQGLPNRLWVGLWGPVMNKLEITHYKRARWQDNIWPANWKAVSLRRENNTSRTNAVSFFRSGKWKLLILSPSAGMNRLKQRRTKQSQLIKGCIFKQSKFK